MPQIGWFEILIIVVLAIIIIGPKDFPVIIKKIGSWVGTFKSYISEIQISALDIEKSIDEENSTKKSEQSKTDNNNV